MRYGSVCSGIEAATVAWEPLGWNPAFFSEIEAFPRAVLQHHYPEVPLHGDFTTIGADDYGSINLLVGGTPCQDFSVNGLRRGLDGERGNLTLEFVRLLDRKRPEWLVWENVPGILSINGGRAFGSFLGGLAECGYGFAYRVLDAFYFGCPVPRPRVFVVGYLGDWRRAAAVLFEREAFTNCKARIGRTPRPHTLSTQNAGSKNGRGNIIATECGWRGMTPIETERAMGFSDNYTAVPYRGKSLTECPDRARYKALGNSMAVPCMAWIGRRIERVESIGHSALIAA